MTDPVTSDQIFIRKLTDIILENLRNENFGVKDLAHEANISQYVLNRKLKSISKRKVNQFIREVRLQKALELLQRDHITASEAAYKVGFGSPAYFNKCFHEYYGYPPGKAERNGSYIQEDVINHPNGNINLTVRRKHLITIYAVFGIVLISVVFAVFVYMRLHKSLLSDIGGFSGKRVSIAVMPFRNLTNDTIWNIWQEGIQEGLISSLSNSKELKILRKERINTLINAHGNGYATISLSFSGLISKKLDADMFILGSIKKAGPKIRLDAQLINTKTDEILKSFEINGPNSEEIVFEITDSLRQEVTDFLMISELITENPWLKSFARLNTHSPEALKYYIYGYKAYYKADWATARNWFFKVLAIDSTNVDVMSRIYYTYKNQKKAEQFLPWLLKLYNKAGQMSPIDELYIKFSYAEIFESTEVRVRYLRQLQEIDDQGNYYYLIGAMYVRNKQFAKSIPEYEKYLEISRKRGRDYLKDNWGYPALGEMYHITGQYKKAKKLYQEAERVNEDHSSIYFSWIIRDQGSLALAEGDTIAANKYIKEFISVIKENSESEADISEGLGDMYWLAEKWEEGEKFYRKSLSLDSVNPSRMNSLAKHLIERNHGYNQVSELMDKAIGLAANKMDYYSYLDTKGWGLYKEGKIQEAVEILQKVWDETPIRLYSLRSHLDEVRKALE